MYDPSEGAPPYSLLFNRMSPSAYLRGGIQGMFITLSYLAHLERVGLPVVNGLEAFTIETSKARQLTLLESLGLPYPKARVINSASRAVEAAEGLRFPLVVKANIGGSGAGIVRYDSMDALKVAAEKGGTVLPAGAGNAAPAGSTVPPLGLDFGVDHTALVQEYVPARGGHITRVELLGGKFLYAINVFTTGESFNLCPADICQRADGVELVRSACPIDAPKTGLKVEGYTPPPSVIEACERIVQAASIDVGGIEYMVDDRDGSLAYYDINALSNFVADAKNVIGFDPFSRLVDYLEMRAK